MNSKVKFYLRIFLMATLPSFFLFLFLTFPYGDLGNLVSSEVAKQTNSQVIFTFKDMGFQAFPSPGLNFEKVKLAAAGLPPLSMNELELSPSISGLLSFKPGARVSAAGIFGGDLLLNTKGADENSKGVLKHSVYVEATKVALEKILKDIRIPIKLGGNLSSEIEAIVDPSMQDEPEADIKMNISPFKLMGGSINTGVMGMINLPPLEVKRAQLEATLKKNKLSIKKLLLGSTNEAVEIKITANMDLRFRKIGPRLQPSPGPYDATIEINAGPEFERDFGVYLSFLEQYKTSAGARSIFKMKLSGISLARPPRIDTM